MKLTKTTLALGMLFSGLAGCDALTDGGYEGEPKLVVSGSIQSLENASNEADTYVAILWANWAQSGDTYSAQMTSVADQSFPADFTLALYDDPLLASLNDFTDPAEGMEGHLGTGYVVVFDDLNGNGMADTDDSMRGFSPTHLVLYAADLNQATLDEFAASGLVLNPSELVPGYNLAELVCAEPGELFDHLQVVPSQEVTIEESQAAEDGACLDFF